MCRIYCQGKATASHEGNETKAGANTILTGPLMTPAHLVIY